MSQPVYKIFKSDIKSYNDDDLIIEHFISTESEDRAGDIMDADGMVLDGWPTVLKQHGNDIEGSEPIAKPLSITVGTNAEGTKGIIVKTQYYDGSHLIPPDNTGRRLYEKAKNNFMPYWSIGFLGLKMAPKAGRGIHYKKWLLVEYSQVGVPENVEAATIKSYDNERLEKEANNIITYAICKSVIPYKKYSLADEDTPWDGAAEVKKADVADLKKMCAWYKGDGENKGDYKLPHHKADDYTTVWNGVKAAMGALLGARGGVDIPDSDRKGVYKHLAKHYKDFDKEPPEFKSIDKIRTKANPDNGGTWKYCVCDECGYITDHKAGEPCGKCPDCGEQMHGTNDKKKKSTPVGVHKDREKENWYYVVDEDGNQVHVKSEDGLVVVSSDEINTKQAELIKKYFKPVETGLKSIAERVKVDIPWNAMTTLFFAMMDELWSSDGSERTVKAILKEFTELIFPHMLAFARAMNDDAELKTVIGKVIKKSLEMKMYDPEDDTNADPAPFGIKDGNKNKPPESDEALINALLELKQESDRNDAGQENFIDSKTLEDLTPIVESAVKDSLGAKINEMLGRI